MIYLTQPKDTPASIAAKFSGQPNADFAKQIKQANLKSMAQVATCHESYFPNRPIWIPTEGDTVDAFERDYIVRQFDWLHSNERSLLRTVQRRHMDVVAAAHAHQLVAKANQITSAHQHHGFLGWLSHKSSEFFGSVSTFESHHLHRFEGAVNEVKEKLLHLKSVAETGVKADYHAARGEFKRSFKHMHEMYQDEINRFKLERKIIYRKYCKLERAAVKDGIKIMDTSEMEKVIKFARYCKYAGNAVIIGGIVEDIVDIHKAYEEHGHWIKMAVEDVLEVGGAIAIGALVGLAFTGGGWAVLLGAGIAEVTLNAFFDAGVKKGGELFS